TVGGLGRERLARASGRVDADGHVALGDDVGLTAFDPAAGRRPAAAASTSAAAEFAGVEAAHPVLEILGEVGAGGDDAEERRREQGNSFGHGRYSQDSPTTRAAPAP